MPHHIARIAVCEREPPQVSEVSRFPESDQQSYWGWRHEHSATRLNIDIRRQAEYAAPVSRRAMIRSNARASPRRTLDRNDRRIAEFRRRSGPGERLVPSSQRKLRSET